MVTDLEGNEQRMFEHWDTEIHSLLNPGNVRLLKYDNLPYPSYSIQCWTFSVDHVTCLACENRPREIVT